MATTNSNLVRFCTVTYNHWINNKGDYDLLIIEGEPGVYGTYDTIYDLDIDNYGFQHHFEPLKSNTATPDIYYNDIVLIEHDDTANAKNTLWTRGKFYHLDEGRTIPSYAEALKVNTYEYTFNTNKLIADGIDTFCLFSGFTGTDHFYKFTGVNPIPVNITISYKVTAEASRQIVLLSFTLFCYFGDNHNILKCQILYHDVYSLLRFGLFFDTLDYNELFLQMPLATSSMNYAEYTIKAEGLLIKPAFISNMNGHTQFSSIIEEI